VEIRADYTRPSIECSRCRSLDTARFLRGLFVMSGTVGESALPLDDQYIERTEYPFTVGGRADVSLTSFSGSIDIHAWERPEVLVVVEKIAPNKDDAAAIQARIEQAGNHIRVDIPRPTDKSVNHSFTTGRRHVRLFVSLPAASDVEATTGAGAIGVDRISGRVTLQSGAGDLDGRGLNGSVTAMTGAGKIDIDDVKGDVDAQTGSGAISIRGSLNRLKVRSSAGSIIVRAVIGTMILGDWNISSGVGNIDVTVPDDINAELDARTDVGSLDAHLSTVTERSTHHLHGRVGSGGRCISVRTGVGSITVRGPQGGSAK
jgi:hypothetical protein